MNEKQKKYMRYSSYAIATLSLAAIVYESGIFTALGVFSLLWANNISLKIK